MVQIVALYDLVAFSDSELHIEEILLLENLSMLTGTSLRASSILLGMNVLFPDLIDSLVAMFQPAFFKSCVVDISLYNKLVKVRITERYIIFFLLSFSGSEINDQNPSQIQ